MFLNSEMHVVGDQGPDVGIEGILSRADEDDRQEGQLDLPVAQDGKMLIALAGLALRRVPGHEEQ